MEAPADTDFATFYRREYTALVRLTYTLTGRLDVAEEIAQDAFLAAHRNWDRLQHYDLPGAWVRRVATNAAVSGFRRRAREVRALGRLWRGPAAMELPEPAEELWVALRSLPKRQAQVLALLFVEDRRTADVAAVHDCSEDTVRTHARRGRQTLARILQEER